jgi:hypothetical protein
MACPPIPQHGCAQLPARPARQEGGRVVALMLPCGGTAQLVLGSAEQCVLLNCVGAMPGCVYGRHLLQTLASLLAFLVWMSAEDGAGSM